MWGSLARGITETVKETATSAAASVAPHAGDVLRRVGEVVAPPMDNGDEEYYTDDEEEDDGSYYYEEEEGEDGVEFEEDDDVSNREILISTSLNGATDNLVVIARSTYYPPIQLDITTPPPRG